MHDIPSSSFAEGLAALRHPILPLIRLVQMLYLTGPFATVGEILPHLTEPIDTEGVVYERPGAVLFPYLPVLEEFERLKSPAAPARLVVDEKYAEVDPFEAMDAWICHSILIQELERINSLLCGPCKCTLCCIGPDAGMTQFFFEIPLAATETALFSIPGHDTAATRATTAQDEPSLTVNGVPFYQNPTALYHFRTGWSLILPRSASCPNLGPDTGLCSIYPERPEVCRRPPIFAYVLERQPDTRQAVDGRVLPVCVRRGKLLAVWDCPFVKGFQEEIANYAALSGVEAMFKQNKS